MTMETREIKFRAWYPTTQQMYMDCLVGNKGKLIALEYEYECGDITTSYATDTNGNYPESFKLMQYTGLKDKNGVDIYDGDIIKIHYNNIKNDVVIFENGKYNICNYNISKCEIIGNIYENPELL